jgi:hypothetical protein
MRYTVIDGRGTVSFIAECDALPLLVSGCADGARTLESLLDAVARRNPRIRGYVTSGLAVFDEHNTPERHEAIRSAIKHLRPHELPVFRVVDDVTRQASLQAVKAGVIIFNLRSRRIIQIQNTYAEIRSMLGKVRRLERAGWKILP